jgi:hypothetical protein
MMSTGWASFASVQVILVDFLRLWFAGYVSPGRFIEGLRSKPAPHWGVYAQLLRGLLDSLLVYLPVALMGRIPPTPSFLPFIPTERYYAALIWLAPVVLVAELLIGASFLHVALRLLGRPSNFDQILNIVGMAALIVGAVLIPWDWLWFALGRADQYFLGISHLLLSLWGTLLIVVGLHRLLDVPRPLAVLLSLLAIPVSLPVAIMFMRSPF